MTQPTKTDSDEGGRNRLRPDCSWWAFAASQVWFLALAAGLGAIVWGVAAAVEIEHTTRLVVLAWSACVLGALTGRVAAEMLRRAGVGAESYLVSTLARPLFPLLLFLALAVMGSELSGDALAALLVVLYLAILALDTSLRLAAGGPCHLKVKAVY